jgi:hypothetical protein
MVTNRSWGWILCAGAAIAIITDVAVGDEFPGQEVTIQELKHRGTGCRDGSVAHNISPDGKAMTLLFADYVVDSSERDGRPSRKACDIDVKMKIPSGWAFTLFGVQVRGYASIERGAVGVQQSAAGFGGRPPQAIGRLKLEGAFDGDYENFSDLPLTTVEWSPCGTDRVRNFNLKTFITVRPKNGFRDTDGDVDNPNAGQNLPKGMMTIDSLDGSLEHQYTIAWRRCQRQGNKVEATCRLKVGQREYTGTAVANNHQRAKVEATDKAVNTCKLSARPQQRSKCKPARAICSYAEL